ncbi:uncharacterized protein [Panulirus ornatus]|uniref:uncharacterized protein n=1 Tax=Panulirus ornatus TaxID=150431 RepID=UPI003A855B63
MVVKAPFSLVPWLLYLAFFFPLTSGDSNTEEILDKRLDQIAFAGEGKALQPDEGEELQPGEGKALRPGVAALTSNQLLQHLSTSPKDAPPVVFGPSLRSKPQSAPPVVFGPRLNSNQQTFERLPRPPFKSQLLGPFDPLPPPWLDPFRTHHFHRHF